jgi:hypothetical protein
MLTEVGAFGSSEMFELGHDAVLVETGVPHWRPLTVTAYGFGF